MPAGIAHRAAGRGECRRPGAGHPDLSWTH